MISNLDQQQWDTKSIELGGSILQSWGWGEFLSSIGHTVHRFSGPDFLCQGAEISLMAGKKYLYCPRGPLGNIKAAMEDIQKLEENRQLVFARVEPHQVMQLPKALKDVQPVNNWILDTAPSEESLMSSFKPKTRYNINLAIRKGVEIRNCGKGELIDFFKLMMETSSRNSYRLHPQNYYIQMWEHLYPKSLQLLMAYYQGEPVAGVLLTVFGGVVTYLHGGSTQKYKEVMAPYLLHWEAIRLTKQLNCTTYDFGGIAPNDEPAHPWAGITRFKKSFGGVEVVYPGAYDHIYSPIWYNGYKNARKLRGIFS